MDGKHLICEHIEKQAEKIFLLFLSNKKYAKSPKYSKKFCAYKQPCH